MAHRDEQESLVYVGRDDVALLREVLRLANDVVATVSDGRDEGRALLVAHYLDPVAHSDRVCAAYPFQPEVSLYLALHRSTVIRAHGVPATGILDYQSFHLYGHYLFLLSLQQVIYFLDVLIV